MLLSILKFCHFGDHLTLGSLTFGEIYKKLQINGQVI